jgi:hypothetical protein
METRPKQPFRAKRGFFAALASLLSLGIDRESDKYRETERRGHGHGKHNGAQPGAFGGPRSAKAHRRLYVTKP